MLERLQLSLVIMQRSLFQFGGSISRLQIDDKGTSSPRFVPGLPHVILIELRQALISYQDYHVLFGSS